MDNGSSLVVKRFWRILCFVVRSKYFFRFFSTSRPAWSAAQPFGVLLLFLAFFGKFILQCRGSGIINYATNKRLEEIAECCKGKTLGSAVDVTNVDDIFEDVLDDILDDLEF